jgi:DnaJ-class molecular chaperone
VPELAPTEIKALVRIMDELDYYQLIHVAPGASMRELKRAYYSTSRSFHPDANRHREAELRCAVAKISKRVTEAYTVLRDPLRREAYDRMLAEGSGVRQQLSQAQEATRQSSAPAGDTPQGRQYWSLAQADLARGDFAAAARNLQTALTFEPGNAAFKQALQDARAKS